jgi:hypothetical protein
MAHILKLTIFMETSIAPPDMPSPVECWAPQKATNVWLPDANIGTGEGREGGTDKCNKKLMIHLSAYELVKTRFSQCILSKIVLFSIGFMWSHRI